MAETRYIFTTPEQLKEIALYIKHGNVMSVARVWSAEARRNGRTPWDGKIGVRFYTEGKERHAEVFRFSTNNELLVLAKLKYAPALAWYKEHRQQMTQADDA